MSAIKKLLTKSFLERTISGILLVVIALVTIIAGDDILLATIGAISLIGFYELVKVFKMEKSVAGIIGKLNVKRFFMSVRSMLANENTRQSFAERTIKTVVKRLPTITARIYPSTPISNTNKNSTLQAMVRAVLRIPCPAKSAVRSMERRYCAQTACRSAKST